MEKRIGARWNKTRPDTRLPQSRAGGQGPLFRMAKITNHNYSNKIKDEMVKFTKKIR